MNRVLVLLLVGCGGAGSHVDLDEVRDLGVGDLSVADAASDLSSTDGQADLASTPSPRYAYLATSGLGIAICSIDNDTGALTPLAMPHDTTPTGFVGQAAISPDGTILVDGENGGYLASDTLDPTTGLLTLADSATAGAWGAPVFSADGKTLYIGDLVSSLIHA
jgi:hypothetical protein